MIRIPFKRRRPGVSGDATVSSLPGEYEAKSSEALRPPRSGYFPHLGIWDLPYFQFHSGLPWHGK